MVSCGECNSTDVDIEENFCNECGEELQEEAEEEKLVVVGVIREVLAFQTNKLSFHYFEAEPVPKKDKLTKLKVEVGEGKEITIVTNAKHCDPEKVQYRIENGESCWCSFEMQVVVVALVGANVPTMDQPVERAVVGGVR